MNPITEKQCKALFTRVKQLYDDSAFLPFHGWHHVEFVYKKSADFARDLGADVPFTQSCALVHDLNYMARPGVYSSPAAGKTLRQDVLSRAGFDEDQRKAIEDTVISAETAIRTGEMSSEAMALADADTLFKALPVTPLLFTGRFIEQNNYNIAKLAKKIVSEQKPLMAQDIYFYSEQAKAQYMKWARVNLQIWEGVMACLDDPDIIEMLKQAGFNPGKVNQ